MVVVLALRVDLGLGPAEYAEGVVGSEVDEWEGEGTRPGLPRGGFREEEVADEVVVGGGGRRVDAYPVQLRR